MSLILAPIVDGKMGTWKQWATDLKDSRAEEFKEFNTASSDKVKVYAGPVVAALHEGPGAENFMSELATSDHDFDVWFRDSITEIHNIDFSAPLPGSPPQLLINAVG